jgi:hypothetical protein
VQKAQVTYTGPKNYQQITTQNLHAQVQKAQVTYTSPTEKTANRKQTCSLERKYHQNTTITTIKPK